MEHKGGLIIVRNKLQITHVRFIIARIKVFSLSRQNHLLYNFAYFFFPRLFWESEKWTKKMSKFGFSQINLENRKRLLHKKN
jgi:hypothetical protein